MSVRLALLVLPVLPLAAAEPGPAPREVRLDRNGYPLPQGAVARLGLPRPLSAVTDVAWAADGRHFVIASGSAATTFDADTGRPVEAWAPDRPAGRITALSRDAGLLFRQGGGAGHLHDARTGSPLRTYRLGGTDQRLHELTLSADGRFLAGVRSDRIDRRGAPWRYDLAREKYTRISDREDVASVCLSPDGRLAFGTTAGDAPRLVRWDLSSGREAWAVPAPGGGLVRAVSAGGGRVAVVGPDGVRVFDGDTGKELLAVRQPTRTMVGVDGTGLWSRELDFSPDGRVLAVPDWPAVNLWDVDARKVRHRLPQAARVVAFSPDGRSLLTADCWVQRWDVATGRPAYSAPVPDGPGDKDPTLQWSADGRRLFVWLPGSTADPDEPLRDSLTVWDVAAMAPVWRVTPGRVRAAAMDWRGETVWYRTAAGELRAATLGPPGRDAVVPLAARPRPGPWQEVLTRDGRLVLQLRVEAELRTEAYDARTGGRLSEQRLTEVDGWVRPTGRPVDGMSVEALVGPDRVRVDARTGRRRPPILAPGTDEDTRWTFGLPADGGPFVCGRSVSRQTSPGGKTRERDGAHLWEAATGARVADLDPARWSWGIAVLSPGGRFVATTDPAGTVVGDLTDPSWVRTLPEAHAACAFSPDESLLATGTADDGTVLVWPVPRRPADRWEPARAGRLWEDLGSADAGRAWRAVWHLRDHPDRATALLAGRVKPAGQPADVPGLIARLDGPKFADREAAARELAGAGDVVEEALRAALEKPASEEQRARLTRLLDRLDPTVPPAGEAVRQLRCVWLLERVGTPAARRLLAEMAGGAPGAPLTAEATAALGRLPAKE